MMLQKKKNGLTKQNRKVILFILTILSIAELSNCGRAVNSNQQRFVLQYTIDTTIKDLSTCQLLRISKLERGIDVTIEKSTIGGTKGERYLQFKTVDDKVYEIKIISDFNNKPIDTKYILTYCTGIRDTSFLYFYDVQKYPPTQPLGNDDYVYSLKKIDDNLYATYKESFLDSTFSEIEFYNTDFSLMKIIKINEGKYYEFINDKVIKKKGFSFCFYEKYYEKLKPEKKFYNPFVSVSK
jgi:hypothetical protein